MAQNGYNFTPGKYDPVKQTDVVEEQAKSNQRILDSENQFLDEMNARDDDLVEKTRSEWEGLADLSSSFSDWMKKKAEKDKKEKLQKGSYLALITPASKETITALINREKGLKDSHLKINEIANRIEETTGSFELAQQFRDLSGWEQYAYVKASLTKAASGYTDFKNSIKDTIFIKDGDKKIGYDDLPNKAQLAELNAKVRFEFADQFIGVNEELLSATVGTEILKVDQADDAEAIQARETSLKNYHKEKELNSIKGLFDNDPAVSRDNIDFWIENNVANYGNSITATRLALRKRVRDLVANGDLSLIQARSMVQHLKYHKGDKKGTTIEKWKEFEGFDDDLVIANAEWQKKRLDTDKATVKANSEALRDELERQNTVMTIEQKKAYLKQRNEEFPDVPLNADEQFIIYGYRDDGAMRVFLNQQVQTYGGITQRDLRNASPLIREEFASKIIPDANKKLSSLNHADGASKQFVEDQVAITAKSTGSLEAKNLQYYALITSAEELYITTYNKAIEDYGDPEQAKGLAETAVKNALADTGSGGWVEENSEFKDTVENEEYLRKLEIAKRQMKPEDGVAGTGGYATTLLEAPKKSKDELQAWAEAGGKGPVPYYYRKLASDMNIIPRELAWRQAKILTYEGQWDEKEELGKFNVPKSMITMFLCKPSGCKWERFKIDVEELNKEKNDDEVHPYEKYEDID